MARKTVLPLIRKARAGDAASQLKLGRLYLKGGHGLAANIHSALLWLGKAADQGHAEAWQLIGTHISPEHAGSTPDLIRWYEMAANDGSAPAQTKLAKFLLSRTSSGTSATALGLLRSAAAKGDAVALTELGVQYLAEQAKNGDSDAAGEAVDLLERAYAAGEIIAARHLADHFWQSGNPDLARLWYSRCVDLQDVELCYRFGLLSALLGVPGKDYLYRAAEAGHPLACEELGLRYALGCRNEPGGGLGSRSFKKAVRWLERAASLGSAKACFFLALLYDHHNCSFRSRNKSQEWLWKAATRGYPEAQYRIGARLLRNPSAWRAFHPQGLSSDESDLSAIRLLADAAQQGHSLAAQELAEAGCSVCIPSESQAQQWAQAVSAMSAYNLPLAARMELASAMGLQISEMLLIDPVSAYRKDCLVVDLRQAGVRSRRRVVLVENAIQREIVEKAVRLFAVSNPLPGDLVGSYRARYKVFTRLCARAGIDLQLFKRNTADTRFNLGSIGGSSTVAVGSSMPLSDANIRTENADKQNLNPQASSYNRSRLQNY
ncbi:Secretory immunoglobulin A-binding protein EsiB [Geobacteraceae bacterium]|nr:Secretory immunoglobulin A-binding protein EsiB [Geobacteraceae bacterium]